MTAQSTYAAATDVGQDRELNEDNHGEFELDGGGLLLVVCDGMGGHEGGEVASQIAVDAIGQIFQNSPAEDPGEKLANGFRVANQRILAEAERANAEGMGTTAVAVYLDGNRFTSAHVGDSRVYQVRGGAVVWHTLDHTRVQKMVDKGILDAEEAKSHPDANVVTRALGYRETAEGEPIEADVLASPRTLQPGDTLVLCSDGLYDGVSDQEIADTVTGAEPDASAQELVDFANRRGGHDNITVCVVRFDGAGKAAAKKSDKARGSVRITDLDDAGGGRQTALDEPSSSSPTRTTAPVNDTTNDTAAVDPEEKKRKLAAIFLFAIAAAIAAIVVYLVFVRGSDGTRSTPSQGPGPSGGALPASAGDGHGSTAGGTSPLTHDPGDAPPLPENPVVNGPAKPTKPDAPAGDGDGDGDPAGTTLSPNGVGGSIPVPQGGAPPPATAPKKRPAKKMPAPKKQPASPTLPASPATSTPSGSSSSIPR
jgi:protein phosphatase